jgi:hypothetical protein
MRWTGVTPVFAGALLESADGGRSLVVLVGTGTPIVSEVSNA